MPTGIGQCPAGAPPADLFEDARPATIEDGVAHARGIGGEALDRRADDAVADLPAGLVYAGLSFGGGTAQAPVRRERTAFVRRGRSDVGRAALAGVSRPGGLTLGLRVIDQIRSRAPVTVLADSHSR